MERLRRPRPHGAVALELPHAPARTTDADEGQRAGSQAAEAGVEVIYGASVQTLPFAGLRVAVAARLAQTILRVEARSPALVNGRPVRPDHVLARGESLEFVHYAGEKGKT